MKQNTYWELPPGYSLQREVKLPEDRSALKIMAVLQLVLAGALILFGALRSGRLSPWGPHGQQLHSA